MASFSDHSERELETVHPDLELIHRHTIPAVDYRVTEGHRGKKRQNRLYREGKSEVQWPESGHNTDPAMASDFAPWPIDWSDTKRFVYVAGHLVMTANRLYRAGEIKYLLRWGGNWDQDKALDDNQFDDLGHVELIRP
jgi:hypothetical protein